MQYSLVLLALAAASASANPLKHLNARQAVTASIAPDAPPPPGCTTSASGSYAVVVRNVSTTAAPAKRQATQIADGQPQITHASVSMINDGQIQAGMQTKILMPVANQIHDGQIQVQTVMAPVTEFKDGQPQAPTIATPTPTATATGISEAPDAQVVATTAAATTAAPTSAATSAAADSSSADTKMIACDGPGELMITLDNGILTDAKQRTGYIASNFQLQFDGPPQAGAIYTAGFSVCANSSLALGGSNIFYQCLSGSFYNLYDRHWAAQCSPVTISTLELQQCS